MDIQNFQITVKNIPSDRMGQTWERIMRAFAADGIPIQKTDHMVIDFNEVSVDLFIELMSTVFAIHTIALIGKSNSLSETTA